MKPILHKGTKQIIYLDQFGTSGIFESETTEWNQVRDLILEGVKESLFICPMSTEHFFETSQKENKKAVDLDNNFYALSGGYGFKSELFTTSQLIISLIRENNVTIKTYLYENIKENVLANNDNLNFFDKQKKVLNQKIEEATIVANEIRKSARNIKSNLRTNKILFDAHKSISISEFISRLNDLMKNEHIYIRGVKFPSGDVPHWIDQIIFQLTKKHRMNKKETKLLINHLRTEGFNNIPTLDIRTSLSAIISIYNKRETVNDQIDISRIATGLPISDILLTDKKRKNELLELGLDVKYNTSVFDGTKKDLEKLILKLKQIKTTHNKVSYVMRVSAGN